MNDLFNLNNVTHELTTFLAEPNAFRSILILVGAIAVSYFASKYLAKLIIKLAQVVSTHSEKESNDEKLIRLRQIETYLSVAVAGVRAVVVTIVAYITWRLLSPASSSGIAAIGASAIFVVFAGQSVGMLLRDLTSGSMMIIEQWFNVGDYIKVEPFNNVAGIVERFTLRSTKLRGLSGETLWVHNQHIQAVLVTPRGLRTIAVDVFVKDKLQGTTALKKLIKAVPTGPTMLTAPLKITSTEKWSDGMWRISIVGHTLPGREWLIEKFFVNAIKEVDEGVTDKSKRVFIYEPIARFADPVADRRFKRAIRANKNS